MTADRGNGGAHAKWSGIHALTVIIMLLSSSVCVCGKPGNGLDRRGEAAGSWGNSGAGRDAMGGGNSGRGSGGMGPKMDDNDMDTIHNLLSNRHAINRTVAVTQDGVRTRTFSSDEQVARWIKEHVAAMKQRVENNEPVRLRDPLFNAVFQHAEDMHMETTDDRDGMTVATTGNTKCAVALAKAHAEVVTGFIKYGHDETRKNHDIPEQCN